MASNSVFTIEGFDVVGDGSVISVSSDLQPVILRINRQLIRMEVTFLGIDTKRLIFNRISFINTGPTAITNLSIIGASTEIPFFQIIPFIRNTYIYFIVDVNCLIAKKVPRAAL